MENKPIRIIDNLDIKEKAYLLTGKSFWTIGGLEKHGLQNIIVSDGPHGLRRAIDPTEAGGNSESIKAVCFPTASAQACSFDEDLLFNLGKLLGDVCQAENVQVLLGPANNIKRTPLCGRNFEYYSEDPLLAGKLSAALIKGVQSKGIGTSLKHFVANNQEKSRMTINAIIDERTLREIYLTAFEIPVKESKPWTIMGSYNRINGYYACQNSYLLNDILRTEWKFNGLVMSDWGAVDQLHESIEAGMDVEMPTSGAVGPEKIIKAVKKGKISLASVDEATKHVVELIEKSKSNRKPETTFSKDDHHQKAREIGRECIVLLKNESDILPLTKEKYNSIALIGDFAIHPRFQGGGSSHINSYKVDTLLDEFNKLENNYSLTFAQGFDRTKDTTDENMVQEAVTLAKNSDIVVACIGLPDRYENEGVDRSHLNLPPNQLSLLDALTAVNKNIVVVLSIGSVVKLPFIDKIKGLVCNWLLGEAGAGATFDVLTGLHNPSGKLAESFIKKEQDDPSFGNYPGIDEVEYKEGIFIGYRFHDYYNKEVEFPFGFGLSYTTFEYSNLQLSKESIKDDEELKCTVTIKNTGRLAGKEIVQFYVSEVNPLIERPPRELKGFRKVSLESGESKTIDFNLTKRSFAYYNVNLKDWHVSSGEFIVSIAKSSRNIVLEKKITVQSTVENNNNVTQEKVFVKRFYPKKSKKITRNTKLEDLQHHPIGISIYRQIEKQFSKSMGLDTPDQENAVLDEHSSNEFINNLPLRDLVNFSQGKDLSERKMNQLILILNRTRKDTLLGKFIGIFRKT